MTRSPKPVHPGRIIQQEFLEPAAISQYRLAEATGLTQTLISGIVRGRNNITAATALRLERALGVTAQTWLNLQSLYDLEKAETERGREIRATTRRLRFKETAQGYAVQA
jgi:addiction module HigA family antidote